MYAVVAPGLKGVYEDPRAIDRILALYPYTKFRKFKTEKECLAFIRLHENKRSIEGIKNFGDTFNRHKAVMEYFIFDGNLYYNFDTKSLGMIRVVSDSAVIENRNTLIKAMLPNIIVDRDTISGHVIAIYNGLRLIGDFIDVEVLVPDHSILYAIHSYTGTNRVIARLRDHIKNRIGNVSVTLRE